MKRAPARFGSWAFTLAALGSAACASYEAQRLLDKPAAAPPWARDAPRLRTATEALHRAAPSPAPIEVDISDGLSPDEAGVLAVRLNPELVAARDAHSEGQAQILMAAVLPNPVLGAGINQPFGPSSAGTNTSTNLSLAIDLKPYVARSARERAAAAGLAQIDLGIAWQEWQIAEQARLLVVRLGWIRKRLKLAREELDFAEQTATSIAAAGRVGDTTLEQVGVQRAALEGVRRVLTQLEQADVDTESALRALLGNPELEKLEVDEPSTSSSRELVTTSVDACLEGRLDLAALRRGYDAAEEQLRAAVLDQFPAVTVGVAYQRNETALNFIGGFINVELPVFNHNQYRVQLGVASRRRLEHEYDARVARTRAELDQLSRFYTLVARQLAELQRSLGPLEEIELQERTAVAHGDISRMSYQIVRGALFDQRLQDAAVSQALAEVRIGIETTCGGEPGGRP